MKEKMARSVQNCEWLGSEIIEILQIARDKEIDDTEICLTLLTFAITFIFHAAPTRIDAKEFIKNISESTWKQLEERNS